MNYVITIDTETGGVTEDVSLLTAYYGFFKQDNIGGSFTFIDELDLRIKPNDGFYKVTGESLTINNINLSEHDKLAVTERQAGTQLYNKFMDWYKISNEKIIPVGHNVHFDIRFTVNKLISKASWDKFVSYRVLDTYTVAQFLRLTGKLPDNLGSLVNLVNYFNVKVDGNPHEVKYDAKSTLSVLSELMKL